MPGDLVPPQRAYAELLELLRRIQQTNRFISTVYGTPITLLESHLLVELSARSPMRPAQLVRELNVDKSTVSRALRSLAQRKLVELHRDERDRRGLNAQLTPRGITVIQELDRLANSSIGQFCSDLTLEDQGRLADFFRRLGDAGGLPSAELRPSEHPLRPQIRRITRALGLLSTSVLASNLSSVQWHALEEISSGQGKMTAQELTRHLQVAPNTISVLMSALEERGLIHRSPSSRDARILHISLSKQGRAELQVLHRHAIRLFEEAFDDLDQPTFEERMIVVKRFALSGGRAALVPDYEVRKVERLQDRQRARAFVIRELVAQGRDLDAPETIVGKNNFVWMLLSGAECVGTLEVTLTEPGNASLALFITRVHGVERNACDLLLETARQELAQMKISLTNASIERSTP